MVVFSLPFSSRDPDPIKDFISFISDETLIPCPLFVFSPGFMIHVF
jgi:hypothetical protein